MFASRLPAARAFTNDRERSILEPTSLLDVASGVAQLVIQWTLRRQERSWMPRHAAFRPNQLKRASAIGPVDVFMVIWHSEDTLGPS